MDDIFTPLLSMLSHPPPPPKDIRDKATQNIGWPTSGHPLARWVTFYSCSCPHRTAPHPTESISWTTETLHRTLRSTTGLPYTEPFILEFVWVNPWLLWSCWIYFQGQEKFKYNFTRYNNNIVIFLWSW